jgi:hypothetical protein
MPPMSNWMSASENVKGSFPVLDGSSDAEGMVGSVAGDGMKRSILDWCGCGLWVVGCNRAFGCERAANEFE